MIKTLYKVKYMNMKKIWIMIFIFIFLLTGQSNKEFSLLEYFDGDYSAYVTTAEYGGTNLGACYMTSNKKTKNRIGESMVIQNFEVGSALRTLQAKVIKTEYLPTGATVVYAYTKAIKNSVKVDDKTVNIQIACYDDYVVIGWPVIMGSF